jgi:hypothetical protein
MSFTRIWLNFYLHPRRAMDALAQLQAPLYGVLYAFIRGVLLALFMYLLFYLLKFVLPLKYQFLVMLPSQYAKDEPLGQGIGRSTGICI